MDVYQNPQFIIKTDETDRDSTDTITPLTLEISKHSEKKSRLTMKNGPTGISSSVTSVI
jgi:hypothetical protein